MKKQNKILTLALGAILVGSTLGFAGCDSSSNLTQNPEQKPSYPSYSDNGYSKEIQVRLAENVYITLDDTLHFGDISGFSSLSQGITDFNLIKLKFNCGQDVILSCGNEFRAYSKQPEEKAFTHVCEECFSNPEV